MFFLDYSTLVDPLLKDVRTCVTELAGAKPGLKILDVCCGTGDQVFNYSLKGAAATGVDGSAAMLKIAERNKIIRGLQGADFHLADAAGLPFEDGYFDCASVSLCLHEMEREKRGKTIADMKRVVKRGGILVFTDFKTPLPKNRVGYFIRFMEYIAGRDNYRCFSDYMDQGGLDHILKESGLETQTEALLLLQNLQIIKSVNP